MRLVLSLLLLSLLSCANLPVIASEDKVIREVFTTYLTNYNHHLNNSSEQADYSIYADNLTVGTNSGHKLWVLNDFIEASKRFVGGLKETGVAKIEWKDVNVKLLSDKGAVASVSTLRRDKNGEQIGVNGSATYLLALDGEQWKIISFIVHDADTMLTF